MLHRVQWQKLICVEGHPADPNRQAQYVETEGRARRCQDRTTSGGRRWRNHLDNQRPSRVPWCSAIWLSGCHWHRAHSGWPNPIHIHNLRMKALQMRLSAARPRIPIVPTLNKLLTALIRHRHCDIQSSSFEISCGRPVRACILPRGLVQRNTRSKERCFPRCWELMG